MGKTKKKLLSKEFRAEKGALLLRLIGREYLPMIGGLLMWVAVAAAVGHADAVRLLTGMMLVRAARSLTTLDTAAALRRRHGVPAEIMAASFKRAVHVEALSLLAAAALIGVFVLVLFVIDQRDIAEMTLLMAIGLPARHFGPAAGGWKRIGIFRAALSWSGLALAIIALAADLGWEPLALLLGLREWVALMVTFVPLFRRSGVAHPNPPDTILDWREVAGITGRRARHRLAYRIGKSVLGIFGPLGNIAARTARGMGAHRRVSPNSMAPVAAVAAGAAAAAVLVPVILAKPATMLVSASLLRMSAAAGNVLLWWRFADAFPIDEDDDDEDD